MSLLALYFLCQLICPIYIFFNSLNFIFQINNSNQTSIQKLFHFKWFSALSLSQTHTHSLSVYLPLCLSLSPCFFVTLSRCLSLSVCVFVSLSKSFFIFQIDNPNQTPIQKLFHFKWFSTDLQLIWFGRKANIVDGSSWEVFRDQTCKKEFKKKFERYSFISFSNVIASFAYTIHYTAPGFEPTTTQMWVLCLTH